LAEAGDPRHNMMPIDIFRRRIERGFPTKSLADKVLQIMRRPWCVMMPVLLHWTGAAKWGLERTNEQKV